MSRRLQFNLKRLLGFIAVLSIILAGWRIWTSQIASHVSARDPRCGEPIAVNVRIATVRREVPVIHSVMVRRRVDGTAFQFLRQSSFPISRTGWWTYEASINLLPIDGYDTFDVYVFNEFGEELARGAIVLTPGGQ